MSGKAISQPPTWHRNLTQTAWGRVGQLARNAVNALRAATPARQSRDRKLLRERVELAGLLAGMPLQETAESPGAVLVDATWDNPNYWYRYALVRSALGIKRGTETALIGPYQRKLARATAHRLGIDHMEDFPALMTAVADQKALATRLLDAVRQPIDILGWTLPSGVPASLIYDGLLKRQRSARVKLDHPLLHAHVVEALESIAAADMLLDRVKPELVVLSHAIEFRYGSIAWCAINRGIPVVVAFGNYGSLRYSRLSSPAHFFETVDRPYRAQIEAIDRPKAAALAERGRAYLDRRMSGGTEDIGARYAFANSTASTVDRKAMCARFGWDETTPIVSVYASNWFDYPHSAGMVHFSDFLDWLSVTLDSAKLQTGVNWLFRAHPCDQWYGGVTLADLMADSPMDHIRLCPVEWNGAQVQNSVDALVTVHGTAGIEYAVAGKPVLLADRGWYHDIGFARHSDSRQGYINAIVSMEWLTQPMPDRSELAATFAGIYFCEGSANRLILGDDSEQNELHQRLIDMMSTQMTAIGQDAAAIAAWWRSSNPHLHTWLSLQEMSPNLSKGNPLSPESERRSHVL